MRKVKPIIERFNEKVERIPFSTCWHWTGAKLKHGYGIVDYKEKSERLAHRVSYIIHVGSIPEGLHVLHRCDIRDCVNPSHLFLGTPKDNTRDMISKGRQSYPPVNLGSKNINAKLTAEKVIEARKIFSKGGTSISTLARKFNVDHTAMSMVLKRKTWKHI